MWVMGWARSQLLKTVPLDRSYYTTSCQSDIVSTAPSCRPPTVYEILDVDVDEYRDIEINWQFTLRIYARSVNS